MPLLVCAALLAFQGCRRSGEAPLQGYVEGEFVYVASPLQGELEVLSVERGAQVKKGDPLFTLESGSERASREEAERKVAQARSNLDDARRGQRPSEIQAIQAQLDQADAALVLSQREFERQDKLRKSGVSSAQDMDRARAARDQDRQRVSQLSATLETAQLGSRSDQIAAAEAALRAQEAALARAEWDLSQKRQDAPQTGLVFDTLYRQGDWVAAGKPVVVLLPPKNIKARVFVSQGRVGRLHPGDRARVFVDGVAEPFAGRISYISPKSEYTPPVIYSQDMREKLVFLVEISFDPRTAERLHPGQPVDVQFDF
ncbi:MAG: HlyD family efflux transporter periplasmic adaptor subunit [Terrimicrobiaceae bacterium]|nr:HlyD family efflux transporter periplasmic adaptor subunit [Terrimicrobiaceae bacterium]